MGTDDARPRASPDGRYVLFTLGTSGIRVPPGLLFTGCIDGSDGGALKLLTPPSERMANGNVCLPTQGATGLPDGRWVALVWWWGQPRWTGGAA